MVDDIFRLMRLRGLREDDETRQFMVDLGVSPRERTRVRKGEMTQSEYEKRAYERGKRIYENDQRLKRDD